MSMGMWFWIGTSLTCGLVLGELRVELNPQIPFPEGQKVELKATWTGTRDTCQWYLDDRILCTISQGQGPSNCGLDYQVKVEFPSPSTCSLKFKPFEPKFDGHYSVSVSGGPSSNPESSEAVPLCAEKSSTVQLEVGSQAPDIWEVTQNKAVSIDCYARGGRPETPNFKWVLDLNGDFLHQSEYEVSLSQVEFVPGEDENYGFRDAFQTLTMTFPEATDYNLECVALNDDASRDELTVLVGENPPIALTGGAIAGIVIAVLIVAVIIAFLVFIFVTKKLCFGGGTNKPNQPQRRPTPRRLNATTLVTQPNSHPTGTKAKVKAMKPGTTPSSGYVVGQDFQRSAPTPAESEAWDGKFLSLHIANSSSSNDNFHSASSFFRDPSSSGQTNSAFQPMEQLRAVPAQAVPNIQPPRPQKQLIDDGRGYLV